jgi:hypothetical protein
MSFEEINGIRLGELNPLLLLFVVVAEEYFC